MNIKFNPVITKKFTSVIVKDDRIKNKLDDLGLDDEDDIIDLIQTILIVGFKKYKVNINELFELERNKGCK